MNEDITHALLIDQSAKWLAREGHSIIITDMASSGGEQPDAIGWKGKVSTLVECKASRSDFLADRQKSFRRCPDFGMGRMRYFCAPTGLIKKEEIPENWGLLEWTGLKLIRSKKPLTGSRANLQAEVALLVSALRRIGQTCPPGVSIKTYTYATKCRASLGVAKLPA